MGWEYIVVFIIALVVCYAMQPKQTQPTPASLDDMSIPSAQPGGCIPVVFGTRLLASSNIVWYGNLKYEPVETKSGK